MQSKTTIQVGMIAILTVLCGFCGALAQIQPDGVFFEGFDDTTLIDSSANTALWWAPASNLQLYMYRKTFVGADSYSGTVVDVAVSGEYAYAAEQGIGMVIYDLSVKTSPNAIGAVTTPGTPEAIVVKGDNAFMAGGSAGLQILDISSVGGASLIKTVPLSGQAMDLVVVGNYVFVATYTHGIQVVDIDFPPAAFVAGSLSGISGAWGIDVEGDRAYITDRDSGYVWVIDVSDPAFMFAKGNYDTGFNPAKIDVEGDLAYVALEGDGMLILDVGGSGTPTFAGSAPWISVMDVEVEGDWAYFPTAIGTFAMMDVRDPANPVHWGSEPIAGQARAVRIAGEQVTVAAGGGGVELWQVADLLAPVVVGGAASASAAKDIVVQGRTAYVLNEGVGMQIYDITDPENPVVQGGLFGIPGAISLDVDGDLAALAHQAGGVMTIDVSNPSNPVILAIQADFFGTPIEAQEVKIDGDLLHVSGGGYTYMLFDISDPGNITPSGGNTNFYTGYRMVVDGDNGAVALGPNGVQILDWSFAGSASFEAIIPAADSRDVAIDGNTLYVANGYSGIRVVEISNLSSPYVMFDVSTSGEAKGVAVAGDYLFVSEGASGLEVFDITEPTEPIQVHHWYGNDPVQAVAVSGDYCYAAAGGGGLQVLGAFQRSWDQNRNRGQSTVFATEPHTVVQARITATETPDIYWTVSSIGGFEWTHVPADGTWTTIDILQGNELAWRSTHAVVKPRQNPICEDLTVEWLYDIPLVSAVADVPNDQGRQVSLTWRRSGHDAPDGLEQIVEYSVYRKIEGTAAATPDGPEKVYPPGDWHYLMTLPTDREDQYSVVVPTLADSTIAAGQYLSTFFVRARTATPGLYFDSAPVAGYSVDNLEPSVPAGLKMANPDVLAWDDPVDADFQYFTVYQSDSPVFDGTATVIGYTTATTYDVSGHDPDYYFLTATDHAGNESAAAQLDQVSAAPAAVANRFALHANHPNPFNPMTTITFELQHATPVRLAVFDVSGRRVRTLVDGMVMSGGRHDQVWDGRDGAGRQVAGGVYLYQLQAGTYVETRRMSLVK